MKKRGITPKKALEIRGQKGLTETKLQSIRVKKELSQSELAALSKVPTKTIQTYEQQTRPIDGAKLETLCKLAESLDVRIGDILEDEKLLEKYNRVK